MMISLQLTDLVLLVGRGAWVEVQVGWVVTEEVQEVKAVREAQGVGRERQVGREVLRLWLMVAVEEVREG
jgi:hypothetical protein